MPQPEYFDRYKLVEVQSTFYQLPRLTTAERWRAAAPAGFEFTMKAWQLITHTSSSPTYRRLTRKLTARELSECGDFRPSKATLAAWEETRRFAATLGVRFVVFQCPPSFTPSDPNVANMRGFFHTVDRERLSFVWEPRGSWPAELIAQLCQELQLIHCVDPFKGRALFGRVRYYRLHGLGGYSYAYTDEDLERLIGWVREGPSYVLFNNRAMREDSQRFLKLAESG